MFTQLIVHILLNNINKCMHIFDIPIVINALNNQMILKLILSGFYLPNILTYYYYLLYN